MKDLSRTDDGPRVVGSRAGQWLTLGLTTLHIGLLGAGVLLLMHMAVTEGQPSLGVLYQVVGVLCGLAITGPAMATLVSSIAEMRHRAALKDMNQRLEREVRDRVAESLGIRNALIFGLAKLADYRDNDTGTHLERIGEYVEILAHEVRDLHDGIDDKWIERLKLASSLHDIGKVGVSDSVLLKPGRLDPDERLLMEQHPLIGADTLLAIRRKIGQDPFLDMGVEVTLQHHERWDGSGYPFGLAGGQIALSARIVALADFYDAVTSVRVYKSAMPHDEAVQLIAQERGRHFDPAVVDAFLANADRFDRIRRAMHPPGGHRLVPKLVALAEEYLGPERRAAPRRAA